MENNTIARKKRKRIWPIEIISGLFIMMIVLFILMNSAIALQDIILHQKQRA